MPNRLGQVLLKVEYGAPILSADSTYVQTEDSHPEERRHIVLNSSDYIFKQTASKKRALKQIFDHIKHFSNHRWQTYFRTMGR